MENTPEYTLKKSDKSDYENIFDIKKNAMKDYITQTWGWDEEFQRKMHIEEMFSEDIYIISINGKDIGTIGYVYDEQSITICRLYLIDEFQSKGIGSKIIYDIIKTNRGKEIKLSVLKVNIGAKRLYEKLNFRVISEENRHYKMKYFKHDNL